MLEKCVYTLKSRKVFVALGENDISKPGFVSIPSSSAEALQANIALKRLAGNTGCRSSHAAHVRRHLFQPA